MDFIQSVMPYAEMVSDKTGLNPKWIVSQWHLETGGKIPSNNNLGGIQTGFAPYSKYGSPGGLYMSYPSIEFFARDYANFINGKTYRDAGIFQSKTKEEFFTALKTGGYAEDEKYITKGISRYNTIFGADSPVIDGGTIGATRNVTPSWKDVFNFSASGVRIGSPMGAANEARDKMYEQGIAKRPPEDSPLKVQIIKGVTFLVLFIFIGFTVLQLFPPRKTIGRS